MKLNLSRIDSPLGQMTVASDDRHVIHALEFADRRGRMDRLFLERHGEQAQYVETADAPSDLIDAMQRYFAGDLHALDALAIDLAGNELQQQVWSALRLISAGQTKSYGQIARELGYTDPRKAIEIGAAVGANPVAIAVPCHRVIGKGGELKGYAWGVHRKRWLLEHEHVVLPGEAMNNTPMLPGFDKH
jgi:methylated-DNA-[protein]-cysteine S-methyltransferase